MSAPKQDAQSVDSAGRSVQTLIHGVTVRSLVPQIDHRGGLTEMYSVDWRMDDDPVVYVYHVRAIAGSIRGFVAHRKQEDRLYFGDGTFRIVLFDDRKDSPTYKKLNVLYFGAQRPSLLRIPCGVYHGVQNVGESTAHFFNLPTMPYNHADPDKHRLPLDNDLIPFKF